MQISIIKWDVCIHTEKNKIKIWIAIQKLFFKSHYFIVCEWL